MSKRKVSNLLALAVLALLHERPMHPYEIAAVMRQRGLSNSIKLNTGSLYSVVEALHRNQLILPLQTQKEGRHPERTVYAPTEEGSAEFFSWLRTLIQTPMKEYTQFAAGLAFLAHLPPQEAVTLLEERLKLLCEKIQEMRASMEAVLNTGVDRLFQIEEEYNIILLEAELAWLQRLIQNIKDGTMTELKEGQVVWKVTRPELALLGREERKGESI